MDTAERWYIGVRGSAYALFAVLGWVLSAQQLTDLALPLVAALGVFTLANIGIVVMRWRGRTSFRETLLWVAPFDLIWLGLLVFAMHAFEDPALPALLAMPVFYAFLLRRRRAWYVAAGAAVTYAIGHIAATGSDGEASLVFVALKSATILFVGSVSAAWASSYERRERTLESERGEKSDLTEELQRRLTELQALSQITEIIHSSLDFDRVGKLVLEILVKVLAIPSCAIFVIDKQKAETIFSASIGIQGGHFPSEPRGIEAVEDVYVADGHFTCESLLDHPMTMVVFCAPAESTEKLHEQDRLVLQAVASELVVAVENSQLYKLTRRLAITDELTALNNYRYLQQRLDEEIERAKRYGKDLSFLMLDVDDFKQFNDINGHLAGDAALAELGRVLRSTVREVDVVARYGGEEFSVILPETDAAGAFVVAEKIREAVSVHPFGGDDTQGPAQITVSVGLATFPTHAQDKEALLREADDALYRAKTSGKDRVRSPASGRTAYGQGPADVPDADTAERSYTE